MVIDTSALAAILFNEPERDQFIALVASAGKRLISAASLLESSMVVEGRKAEAGAQALDFFLRRAEIEVVPVTREQAEMARSAFRRFGKGRHPASLNFGDCFTYALAKSRGEALLFKGNEFSQTDLQLVPK